MPKEKNTSSPILSRTFFLMLAAAALGILAWIFCYFPRLSKVSLRIDRSAAINIAEDYLYNKCGANPRAYQKASVFLNQDNVDTFLQRTLGTKGELEFLSKYNYDLFYWKVRFFRPGEKEEYLVYISSKSGQVIQYKHLIEETAYRATISKEDARKVAEQFLQKQEGIRLQDYVIKDELTETHEKRVEFGFHWRHKDVDMNWDHLPSESKARLLTGAVVTGDEVRSFYTANLSVPETFTRFLEKEMEAGLNLSLVFNITYILLVVLMISQLINSRQHLTLRTVKPVIVRIGAVLGVLAMVSYLNHADSTIMGYPTSQDFTSFLGRSSFNAIMAAAISSVTLIMMALAAEAVQSREPLVADGNGSLLAYARSSFLSRKVTSQILYGCLLVCILLGVQGLIFLLGEKYFGLWTETQWLVEFSNAQWPFLAALFIGLRASLVEEMIFRVFAIHWFTYKLKNIFLAVIIASLIWGFGHTGYPVFPTWFRGVEVTILGLIFSWAYFRFGLLTVLVAHYLFDAFWANAGSLFGAAASLYFWSSVAVLSIPFLWAFAAWMVNRPTVPRPFNWSLNPAQIFHLRVLEAFVERASRSGEDLTNLRRACLNYSWDPAVVAKAFGSTEADQNDTGDESVKK